MAAVGRVRELGEAVRAGGDVGETSVRAGPPDREAMMVKPAPPERGTGRWSTASTTASGGASAASRSQNSDTAAAEPSTSATTPSGVLVTCPARPRPVARV